MKILALSDIHSKFLWLKRINQQISEADLILLLGDITNVGDRSEVKKMISYLNVDMEKILGIFGNMDSTDVNDYLSEQGISLHGQGKIIDSIGFFGLGGSNVSPLNTPQEFPENEISKILDTGYQKIEKAPIKILLSHVPPLGIVDKTFFFVQAGSKSVRHFIDIHDLNLCLSGHIHEARGMETYRNTLVINCGKAADGYFAVIDVDIETKNISAVIYRSDKDRIKRTTSSKRLK